MYRNIVVTLDGSGLAEYALSHAETVARGCEAPTIILVSVVEPVNAVPLDASISAGIVSQSPVTEKFEKDRERVKNDIKAYLDMTADGLKKKGLNTSVKLLIGPVADMIIDYVNKNDVDLVITATHGRSGISRAIMGSTADKILHGVCAAVLMARVPGCGSLFKG
jgi:nucleotide-binding universal stress UspA family protein